MINSEEKTKVYSEIYIILNMLEKKYIEKLPLKLRNLINTQKSDVYVSTYKISSPLNKQELQKETLAMLAIFYVNYWCESEDERKELEKKFYNNEVNLQLELSQKYSYDNLFKKKQTDYETTDLMVKNQQQMILHEKESLLSRIIKKIKSIFHF